MSEVDAVLANPRGRRFCWEVASGCNEDVRTAMFGASFGSSDQGAVRRLIAALGRVDTASIRVLSEQAVIEGLADAVCNARYWEEPDAEDVVLADQEVVAALAPIAKILLGSDATSWWRYPIDVADQHYVQWLGENHTAPPRLEGSSGRLSSWRAAAVREEEKAGKTPRNPRANWSGTWWSTPAEADLVHTSGSRPGLGALQLRLTEDDLGWEHARVWPLRPKGPPRVFEITGPAAWAELVEAYPLRVTRSRLHDWWRTTGTDTEWFIPDWDAVATDYDAVHLSMYGYLTTPGIAIDVRDGATVLAGWGPDTTFWLADVLEPAGQPLEWKLYETDRAHDEWRPASRRT